MDQIVLRSARRRNADNLSTRIRLDEAAAQLETLRTLANAIRQHRLLLEGRQDHVAKIEMTVQIADRRRSHSVCLTLVSEARRSRE